MSRTRIVAFLLIAMVYGSGLFAQNAGLMRAVFQINNGDYRSAYDELTQISPASSEASYYYEALGKAAFLTGKYAEAIQAFEQRTKLPQPGIAFLELAKVYFMQEDFDSGYEFLAKHLQSPSKLPYNNIISDRAFENLDRDRRWIRFWSENWYTTLDDQIAELNSLMLSDFPVLEPLEKLVSDHEDDDEVLILAAQYYNKLRMTRQAQQMIAKSVKPECEDSDLLNIAADLFKQNEDFSNALKMYFRSVTINPYQAEIWMTIIDIYEITSDRQSLINVMEELNAYGVENTKLWLSLARKQMNDKPDSSIALVNQALGINPLDQTALNLRSELFVKAGNSKSAMYDLTQSLDIDPNQPDVYFSRAEIRFQLGDKMGACYDWKKALRYGHRKALDMLYKYCDY